jgi:putative GTP pyrophosphokinase
MDNTITKSQIKNIGKKLRNAEVTSELKKVDLETLNLWRSHHSPSLKYYAKLVKIEALKLNLNESQFTITQRLKRVHSIILKLKRFENMQLSTMDDVAGLRIVVDSADQVKSLTEALREKIGKHKLIKLNNYITHPKDDGYRSVHLIYKVEKTPSVHIEVQIRSKLQHCWATGVEVFGTLEKTSFKTGDGNKLWREFFNLLSSRFALKEGLTILRQHEILSRPQLEKQLIVKIKDMNIIEQLNAYTSIYTSNWRNERSQGRSGKYALLTLDTVNNTTRVSIYPENKFEKALEDYSEIEKTHHSSNEINIVLVNLDNIDNLEKAYPNYFMDTQILSNHLSKIVLGEF